MARTTRAAVGSMQRVFKIQISTQIRLNVTQYRNLHKSMLTNPQYLKQHICSSMSSYMDGLTGWRLGQSDSLGSTRNTTPVQSTALAYLFRHPSIFSDGWLKSRKNRKRIRTSSVIGLAFIWSALARWARIGLLISNFWIRKSRKL